MLQRQCAENGVVYYRSPLLQRIGVRHAFSTRIGGVSQAPFDSLNLGNPQGDVRDLTANIDTNYRLLQSAIGCQECTRRAVDQVHGACSLDADSPEFENGQSADAMVCSNPHTVLSIRTADCVPILLASEDGRFVAAVHAGWRGVVAQVAIVAARMLAAKSNCPIDRLIAAIGPCIGKDAFEVGPEVLDEFARQFDDRCIVRERTGKGRIDLQHASVLQLGDIGFSFDRIDPTDRCTFTHAEEFFSHRRDKGITGRMAALIAVNNQ